jgi:F1F0 ATPase subunit 2
MMATMTLTSLVVWPTLGFLLGTLYFHALRWNVRLFAHGRSRALALGLQLARFALLAAALGIVAVHGGGLALLLGALGIVTARAIAVRRMRSE